MSNSFLSTGLTIEGHIEVRAVYSDGRKKLLYSSSNLVVDGGLSVFSKLIGQQAATPTDLKFTKIRIGDNNTAPAAAQTNIIGTQIAEKTFTTTTEDDGGVKGLTTFVATLETSEGNGNTIREVGLFTFDSTMIARQITGDIAKTSSFAVEFTWRISISR